MSEAININLADARAFQDSLEHLITQEGGTRFPISHASIPETHEMDKASILSLIEELEDVLERPFEFDTIRIKFWALKGKRRVPQYMKIRR